MMLLSGILNDNLGQLDVALNRTPDTFSFTGNGPECFGLGWFLNTMGSKAFGNAVFMRKGPND